MKYPKLILLTFLATLTGTSAQTTWTGAETGGKWDTGSNWSSSTPSTSNAASVTLSNSAAANQVITLTSGVNGSISGLTLTNNSSTYSQQIKSYTSATSETQTFTFDNSSGSTVSVSLAGSGNATILGRLVFTDTVEVSTSSTSQILTISADAATIGGTGTLSILNGQVLTSRGGGGQTFGNRGYAVGDGTGAAGSAIFTVNNGLTMGTATSGPANGLMTIRADGLASFANTANVNNLGNDSSAVSGLVMYGGAQLAQAAGGTVSFKNNGTSALITVASGGSTTTAATISGAGTLALDSFTATNTIAREISIAKNTAAGSADLQISALISDGDDNMTYNKTGAGILEITSNNTSTLNGNGTWNIQAGGLLVNNTSGSATGAATMSVTIGSSASLGGTGTIAGNVSISGAHNPGNSPGVQTFGGNLTYNENATVNWELSSNTIVQGAGTLGDPYTFDQIVVTGTLDFAGATTLNLAFNGSGSTVNWTDNFWTANRTWLVYDSTTTNNYASLTLSAINWTDGFGNAFNTARAGASFSLSQSGQDIYLNYTAAAIPEPSTYAALAGLGALGFVMWQRRRRAKEAATKSA